MRLWIINIAGRNKESVWILDEDTLEDVGIESNNYKKEDFTEQFCAPGEEVCGVLEVHIMSGDPASFPLGHNLVVTY